MANSEEETIIYITITARDEDIIKYLNDLWSGITLKVNNIFDNIFIFFTNQIVNIFYNNSSSYNIQIIENNLSKLQNLGNLYYNNKNNNDELIDILNNNFENDKKFVIEYLNSNNETRKKMLYKFDSNQNQICICYVKSKYKHGSQNVNTYPPNNLENFRYFIKHHNIIKILDRLWYNNVLNNSNFMPNHDIFIVQLQKNNEPSKLISSANNNTLSIDNVLLLDLVKAYDSVEWIILKDLLFSNFKRKMNYISSVELFEQYMIILTNRIIKYKNQIIKVSKSISTGLPSSLLVFTYILEEIFLRWLDENIYNFQINIDFILNIYVDDIYIKILNFEKKDIIINSIIQILSKYYFNISYKKSRISKNLLNNNFKELLPNDLYLGIPFTRDIPLYMSIILNECNKNYNSNYTWNQIFEILNNEIIKNNKKKRKLNGYLNYKLKPILNNLNVKDFIEEFLNNV